MSSDNFVLAERAHISCIFWDVVAEHSAQSSLAYYWEVTGMAGGQSEVREEEEEGREWRGN